MEESGGGNHFIFQETDQLVEDLSLDWANQIKLANLQLIRKRLPQ